MRRIGADKCRADLARVAALFVRAITGFASAGGVVRLESEALWTGLVHRAAGWHGTASVLLGAGAITAKLRLLLHAIRPDSTIDVYAGLPPDAAGLGILLPALVRGTMHCARVLDEAVHLTGAGKSLAGRSLDAALGLITLLAKVIRTVVIAWKMVQWALHRFAGHHLWLGTCQSLLLDELPGIV